MKLKYLLCLCPLALTGCIGYNTALFMTKSNAGLDFDMKPPTMEINISRKEGVVEPSFEGGKTPPVLASFGTKSGSGGGLGRFFFGVDQTFAGGDAAVTMAKLYDDKNVVEEGPESDNRFDSGLTLLKVPKANKSGASWFSRKIFGMAEPGETRPFFFGTDSQLGVKVGWNGVGGPYPDNVKIGFNRKEIAVAPVTFTPRAVGPDGAERTNVVRIPSFLATVTSDVEAGGDVKLSWMQYFATGDSARYLARQYGVREAMLRRADPAAKEASTNTIERAAAFTAEKTQKRVDRILDAIGDTNKVSDAAAIRLAANPPVVDPKIDKYVLQAVPPSLSATNAPAARQSLKMRAVMSGNRDEEELAAWEAAVEAVE